VRDAPRHDAHFEHAQRCALLDGFNDLSFQHVAIGSVCNVCCQPGSLLAFVFDHQLTDQ
jgi:hypothetical protein